MFYVISDIKLCTSINSMIAIEYLSLLPGVGFKQLINEYKKSVLMNTVIDYYVVILTALI